MAEALFAFADALTSADPDFDPATALLYVCSNVPVQDEDGQDLPLVGMVVPALCRLAAEAIGCEPAAIVRAGVREALAELEVHIDDEKRV